jgi:hypothetical protein
MQWMQILITDIGSLLKTKATVGIQLIWTVFQNPLTVLNGLNLYQHVSTVLIVLTYINLRSCGACTILRW